MILVSQFLTEVSRYLVDQEDGYEFTHWEQDRDLLRYLQLATGLLAMVAKRYYTKVIEITVSGDRVELPSPCSELHDVLGFVGSDGRLWYMRKVSTSASRLLNRPICGTEKYPSSYQYDKDVPGVLLFGKPVPAGTKLRLVCYAVPDLTGGAEEQLQLPGSMRPILFELMLYYAYGRDVEASSFRERSLQHLKNAIEFLKMDASIPPQRLLLLEKKVG